MGNASFRPAADAWRSCVPPFASSRVNTTRLMLVRHSWEHSNFMLSALRTDHVICNCRGSRVRPSVRPNGFGCQLVLWGLHKKVSGEFHFGLCWSNVTCALRRCSKSAKWHQDFYVYWNILVDTFNQIRETVFLVVHCDKQWIHLHLQ
jgi:hypothetical protein